MINELLTRFPPIEAQLEALLADLEANKQQNLFSYGLLRDILESLKQLRGRLAQEPIDLERCRFHAGALGRVALESVEFADSELGTQLLWLISDIIKMAEGRSG